MAICSLNVILHFTQSKVFPIINLAKLVFLNTGQFDFGDLFDFLFTHLLRFIVISTWPFCEHF